MIIGSFSFSYAMNTSSIMEHIREVMDNDQMTFYHLTQKNFSVGYFLNGRLPYTTDDICYSDEINDILVLLSGSVYNKPELLTLCSMNEMLPEPALIAELFMKEGLDFVKRLNGDFAIFICRPVRKQCYLFRDQVGIRPLSYIFDSESLFFSTDVIGLCKAFSENQAIDEDYLLGYFKYINYRKTPNEKVKKLQNGHLLCFSENGIVITRYWEPEKIKIDRTLSHTQMLSDLKSLLWDAVKIRSDRRFTAGAHVSSGIDSGVVSTLAREEYRHQELFYGFSWSPANFSAEKAEFDERVIIGKFAGKAEIKMVFSDMTEKNFPQFVSSFYENQGHFSEDNTTDQAIEVGSNLIFSGWGGDEFISTGDHGIEQDLLRELKLRTFFHRNPVGNAKKFIRNQISYVLNPALGFLNRGTAKSFRNDVRYIKKSFKPSDRKALGNFYFHTSRHQYHIGMLEFYHIQLRCESWAVNGYRKGVEYRYPLLDRRIIEYMLKVPSELLCKTDYFRPIIREISEGILPDEVRWNWSKNDPLYWKFMDDLFRLSAIRFMAETDAWSKNPDLGFVDFDLLAVDMERYKSHTLNIDPKVLFRALVYLKATHEFTLSYRKHS